MEVNPECTREPCPDCRRWLAPDWSLGWVGSGGPRVGFPTSEGKGSGLLVLNKLFGRRHEPGKAGQEEIGWLAVGTLES